MAHSSASGHVLCPLFRCGGGRWLAADAHLLDRHELVFQQILGQDDNALRAMTKLRHVVAGARA